MRQKLILISLLLICFVGSSSAQFKNASFMSNGSSLPYKVMYPSNYDTSKRYPLVIMLHGSGERGTDNEKQLVHGKDFLIDNFHTIYPAIVIVPQCPEDDFWSNVNSHRIEGESVIFNFGQTETPTRTMQVLMALISDWLSSGKVDLKQVYVGGLSMGGMGAFELLWRMPNTFAAAFPICGGVNLGKCQVFAKNTAVWTFHGGADTVVPVQYSRTAYHSLIELGCDAKYSEYEGVGHNSWDNAFAEKELISWLFSHKR